MTENTPTSAELDVATNVLRLTADRTRFSTLPLLRDGETSVTVIVSALDRPIPVIFQHLAKLYMANMVQIRREGTSNFYPQSDEYLTNLVVNTLHFVEYTLYSGPPYHRAQQAYTDTLALWRKPRVLLNLVDEPGV